MRSETAVNASWAAALSTAGGAGGRCAWGSAEGGLAAGGEEVQGFLQKMFCGAAEGISAPLTRALSRQACKVLHESS